MTTLAIAGQSFFPDGKHLLASGIEEGHGARDYLIDAKTGDSKPLTPEGITGTNISPDGQFAIMQGPDGNGGIWNMNSGGLRPIPGLDPKYYVASWGPDSTTLYVSPNASQQSASGAKVYKLNINTGKMEYWKTFGANASPGTTAVSSPRFSDKGDAYAYVHVQVLSQVYVAKGLK
jgi:WD40 repeat protein